MANTYDFSDIVAKFGHLKVNRQFITEQNFCLPLLMDFEDAFGTDPNFEISWAEAMPMWEDWLANLEDQELAKEWEEMTFSYFSGKEWVEHYGVTLMATETYHVFNTNTGTHEEVEGLEAAKARRNEIKEEFINNSLDLFTVTQEFSDSEGNIVLKPVDQNILES